MENVAEYSKLLKKHGKTRHYLNSKLWKEYMALNDVFAILFRVDKRLTRFKLLGDLEHYKGGYPSPNSPPRIDEFVSNLARVFQVYHELERLDDLNSRLHDFGIKIIALDNFEPIKMFGLSSKEQKVVRKNWEKAFGEIEMPTTKSLLLSKMVERAEALQGEICGLSNTIKKGGAKIAKERFGIEKGNFTTAVGLEAKLLKSKKNLDKSVKKVREIKLENLKEAISPFGEENIILPS